MKILSVFIAALTLSISTLASSEEHSALLFVCKFGEPNEAGGAKAHALNIIYDLTLEPNIQWTDEHRLIGPAGFSSLVKKPSEDGRGWLISSDPVRPEGHLLMVDAMQPPQFARGTEMFSAALGSFDDESPRAGVCVVIEGAQAKQLFENSKRLTE